MHRKKMPRQREEEKDLQGKPNSARFYVTVKIKNFESAGPRATYQRLRNLYVCTKSTEFSDPGSRQERWFSSCNDNNDPKVINRERERLTDTIYIYLYE